MKEAVGERSSTVRECVERESSSDLAPAWGEVRAALNRLRTDGQIKP